MEKYLGEGPDMVASFSSPNFLVLCELCGSKEKGNETGMSSIPHAS